MRVLLAVDGSDASAAAVREVQTRAWPPGTRVQVLMVAEPMYPPPSTAWDLTLGGAGAAAALGPTDANEAALQFARQMADRVGTSIASQGVDAEADAVLGDPRDAIVERAASWNADLIVLGSHGRTGIKRWLLGSVAEYVVRHAPCSVEVVREPKKDAQASAQPSV